MERVYNFSAGPAVLPEEVLKECQEEMMNYGGTGMSVMEMSHRSKAFESIINTAEADLRELMNIPDNYKVLFLQGGASLQFAMIPMNLMKNKVADYIITGQWAKKAFEESIACGGNENADTHNELAICLMETGNLSGAKSELLKALSLAPENEKIISNLGYLSLKEGNKAEAQKYFAAALEYCPTDKIAAAELAKLEAGI